MYPTGAEILQGSLVTAGRISTTRYWVMEWLKNTLPDTVAEANAAEDGTNIICPNLRNFYYSREVLTDLVFPALLVGFALQPWTQGMAPRTRPRTMTLMIACISGPIEGAEQVDDMTDLADLVDLCMLRVINGLWEGGLCEEGVAPGRRVWKACNYEGTTQLPTAWNEYAGTAVHYSLDQRGVDLWTPDPP